MPEGIKVHGHWVIEVRDPDGTLAERRKFENALTGSGSGFLSQVLAAQGTIGLMRIVLHSTPCLISGQGGPCSITEGGDTDAQGYFSNLVKNFDGENVVLSGSATAGWDGQIDFVNTALLLCPDVIAPKDCDFSAVTTGGPFTGTELATPIPVAPGQQIQVTVTISFG